MTTNERRLRKYRRKKQACRDRVKFNRLSRLYWRYHMKVYGPTKLIWL